VNRRTPQPDVKKDEAFAFQVQLEITGTRTSCLARTCAVLLAESGTNVCQIFSTVTLASIRWHNVATDAFSLERDAATSFRPVGFHGQKWSAWNLRRSKMSSCAWMHLRLSRTCGGKRQAESLVTPTASGSKCKGHCAHVTSQA